MLAARQRLDLPFQAGFELWAVTDVMLRAIGHWRILLTALEAETSLGVTPRMEPSQRAPLVGRDAVEPKRIVTLQQRRHPAEGVFIFLDRATIVFVTICARRREPRLANPAVHEALREAWRQADRWVIGAYMVMPDHIHFFCAPTDEHCVIDPWITFWKREFRRQFGSDAPRFQPRGFHHRLRDEESYAEKWVYVRENPVRAGLVQNADDWPYQGVIHELRW